MTMRRLLIAACALVPLLFGFLCPDTETNGPPLRPVIDSVVAGINSVGEPGFWIYFHPDPGDDGQDLRGFELFRRTSGDSIRRFQRLFREIPPHLRRVFDGEVRFEDTIVTYEYRILAYDSAIPAGRSDTSNIDSLRSCRAPRLISPFNDVTVSAAAESFRWTIDYLHSGFNQFMGIANADTVLWSAQICNPSCIIMMNTYDTASFVATPTTPGTSVPILRPGLYYWWIRVIWGGGGRGGEPAQSVGATRFRVE